MSLFPVATSDHMTYAFTVHSTPGCIQLANAWISSTCDSHQVTNTKRAPYILQKGMIS